MSNPAHTFHSLWWHFGMYGPQDVHVHTCMADGHGPNDSDGSCDEVLIGWGRTCERGVGHAGANLAIEESVARAVKAVRPAPPERWRTGLSAKADQALEVIEGLCGGTKYVRVLKRCSTSIEVEAFSSDDDRPRQISIGSDGSVKGAG